VSELIHTVSAVVWAREKFGFVADPVQERVLDPGVRRGILNCTRQWGKSTVTALKALHQALHYEQSLVMVASPSSRQSGEFVRKAGAFLRMLGVRVRGDGQNEVSILLPNGSRIVGLPGREATVRGFSGVSLVVVDEASRVPDAVYAAVTPMLAASGPGAALWLMSTPNGKRGFFWDEWSDEARKWTRIAVRATDCPRIRAEFLEEERQRLGESMFRQEYLCEFVDAEDAVFREADVLASLTRGVPPLYPEAGR
jgi:hypothetical protein